MNTRKIMALGVAIALVGAVSGGAWYSHQEAKTGNTGSTGGILNISQQVVTVKGLVGSEKEDFLNDPRVKAQLLKLGIALQIEKVGSRKIVERYDPTQADFGFPSGAPSALELQQKAKAPNVYTPFYTPMVIASWKPIAEILMANGIVKKVGDIYYIQDFNQLMTWIKEGKRWRDLKDNTAFNTGKSILINSTDVRSSNSAGMYLALASYQANHDQIVQSQAEVNAIMPEIAPLFLKQGFQETSSSAPFEDYVALGMGKTPLLMAYESQMVEFFLKNPAQVNTDMVMLYPEQTIYSKHILVPFTPNGAKVGEALERDPILQALAVEYGFRPASQPKAVQEWLKKGIHVPATVVDVIDPPRYEWLEKMIQGIEQQAKS